MKSRNPVLLCEYHCPDGEPHYINGELFVYPSYDCYPDSYCSDKLFVAHSRNLSDWTVDGPAFEISKFDWEIADNLPAGLEEANSYRDLPGYIMDYIPKLFTVLVPFKLFKGFLIRSIKKHQDKDPSKRLLYAPDSVTIGEKSYLFFCTSDGCEGVATANNPAGPFEKPVRITMDKSGEAIKGIDPAVFRDDDGKVYLYWGQIGSFGAQMTEDLTKVKEDTLVTNLLTEKEHCFHEASSMRKIGDTYYYIFADTHRGKATALGYATSKSPLGPFKYQGIIVDNDGCDPEIWNNHGSIECVEGQWYVFYHRSTGNSRYLRRMCAEQIVIDENGLIAEVPVTSIGMGEPYKVEETLPAFQACQVKNAYIDNDKLIIGKGHSEIVYRYIDTEAKFSSVVFDGNSEADLSYKVAENGELTIFIEANKRFEIKSFSLK